jgi:predicted nucleic acid-binding protein
MSHLLDVNALVALGVLQHEFHERVASWVRDQFSDAGAQLLTCSLVELGFVRVLAQVPQYGFTVIQARELLLRLKGGKPVRFGFLADDHDVSQLPKWARSGRQIRDGHLARLALAHGAVLATLDEKIPGAFVIP